MDNAEETKYLLKKKTKLIKINDFSESEGGQVLLGLLLKDISNLIAIIAHSEGKDHITMVRESETLRTKLELYTTMVSSDKNIDAIIKSINELTNPATNT